MRIQEINITQEEKDRLIAYSTTKEKKHDARIIHDLNTDLYFVEYYIALNSFEGWSRYFTLSECPLKRIIA